MTTTEKIMEKLQTSKPRGQWRKGVKWYALYLINDIRDSRREQMDNAESPEWYEHILLNGADSWTYRGKAYPETIAKVLEHESYKRWDAWQYYSAGNGPYIYGEDIAPLLQTPSELKRSDNGRKPPNKYESWTQQQGKALYQAANLIRRYWAEVKAE